MHLAINRRPRTLSLLGALSFALSIGCAGKEDGTPNGAQAGSNGLPSVPGGGNGPGGAGVPGFAGMNGVGAGGSGTGSGGTASQPEPPTQAPPSSQVCPTKEVPFNPLRRLTRFEYANSARALLNVDVSMVADLPVDEITNGFNNNAAVLTVSPLHAEKYVLVSESLAKEAVKNLATLFSCDAATKGEDVCAREFAKTFGRRAFRRAITAQDEQGFMTAYTAGREGGSYAEGIELMIRYALQSPNFLYRLEITPPADAAAKLVALNQFEVATRLSYLVWGSGPDDALLDSAARGELGTKQQVAAKARAMLADPKARIGLIDFYSQWMGTSRLEITTKDTTLFPAYTDAVRAGIIKELPAFMEWLLWTGDHKFSSLLNSQNAFVTGPLAQIYGVNAPGADADTPRMVTLPASQGRSGILTQAGFLAVQAHPVQTSPVLRGKFVRAKLMCQPPPPPPPDADVTPPELEEGATGRERFSAHQVAGSSCNGCHMLMDPIGFAFENFDAVGQYRTTENNKPIDASGEVVGASDPNLAGAFVGVRELADKLASSDLVRDCLATQWFRYAAGRSETQADTCSLATLQEAFVPANGSDGDLLELVTGMAQTDAFLNRGPAQ